ncbi:MAG: NAD-binding protein [Acidimicrobiia bacterium]|nr:MAG: NAD-binding protein [Acidimicrobiia bacterium]
MRTLIIGGGKVGSYLARKLARDGHMVSVIETNHDLAMKVVGATGVIVFEGDGTDVGLLRRADVHRSDWVFAVTGKDDVNLVASQLALTLGAQNVLARLNDPANSPTFSALGVNTVAVTDLMVDVIERDLKVYQLESNTLLAHGKLSVSEFEVGSTFEPMAVQDIDLPDSALLVAIERGDDVFVPHGQTTVNPGDRLVVTSRTASISNVQELFFAGDTE